MLGYPHIITTMHVLPNTMLGNPHFITTLNVLPNNMISQCSMNVLPHTIISPYSVILILSPSLMFFVYHDITMLCHPQTITTMHVLPYTMI